MWNMIYLAAFIQHLIAIYDLGPHLKTQINLQTAVDQTQLHIEFRHFFLFQFNLKNWLDGAKKKFNQKFTSIVHMGGNEML